MFSSSMANVSTDISGVGKKRTEQKGDLGSLGSPSGYKKANQSPNLSGVLDIKTSKKNIIVEDALNEDRHH